MTTTSAPTDPWSRLRKAWTSCVCVKERERGRERERGEINAGDECVRVQRKVNKKKKKGRRNRSLTRQGPGHKGREEKRRLTDTCKIVSFFSQKVLQEIRQCIVKRNVFEYVTRCKNLCSTRGFSTLQARILFTGASNNIPHLLLKWMGRKHTNKILFRIAYSRTLFRDTRALKSVRTPMSVDESACTFENAVERCSSLTREHFPNPALFFSTRSRPRKS